MVWAAVAWRSPGSAAWLFAWVFVVVFHHYDTLYRALGGSAPPRWLVWLGLGWDGRTLLVLLAAWLAAGSEGDPLAALLTWGAPALGLLFVVVASVQYVGVMRRKDVLHA